jgi:glycerol-3-phosphate dehydrogenase
LPGATIPHGDGERFAQRLQERYAGLPRTLLKELAQRHGALAYDVLGDATRVADLGAHLGAELYAREIDYLIEHEWAVTADDVLWRRTKAGLQLDPGQREAVSRYLAQRVS